MRHLIWLAILAVSGLLFGQNQNFGSSPPDPAEKKRGEQMLSQGERMIAQKDTANMLSRIAITVAAVALVVAMIPLFRPR